MKCGDQTNITMKIVIVSILMCCSLSSLAQKSTELHIPIGKSPGVSGKYSTLGTVENINLQDSTITIATESTSKTIELKGRPDVMLDYSDLKQPNKMGSLHAIPRGALIEVKYQQNEPGQPIDWIKCKMEN